MQQRSAQPRVRIRTARSGADMAAFRAPADPGARDHDSSKKQQFVTGPVVTYNVFCLLPVDRRLASNYVYVISVSFNSRFYIAHSAKAVNALCTLDNQKSFKSRRKLSKKLAGSCR